MNITEKLQPEFKTKLLTALRSGDYLQGAGWLYNETESKIKKKPVCCCLGVAANLCGVPFKELEGKKMPDQISDYSFPGGINIFPKVIIGVSGPQYHFKKSELNEMGITSNDYLAGELNLGHILAILNDNGKSFEEIASFIEKNL